MRLFATQVLYRLRGGEQAGIKRGRALDSFTPS
jgi:hypothetical protein